MTIIFGFEENIDQDSDGCCPEKIKSAWKNRNAPGDIFVADGVRREDKF